MPVRHDVYVNGRPLAEIDAWQALKFSHGRAQGPLRCSWDMDEGIHHPSLFWGASVLIAHDGYCVWCGFLNEPGRDGKMSALGLWEQAKGAQAMSSSGTTTAEPREAIGQAIARGVLRWASPVPDVYAGGAAQQLDAPYPAQSVAALIEQVADEQGVNAYIDSASSALVTSSNPTTPTWWVPARYAGEGLTPAADDVATHLYAEYLLGPGQRGFTIPAVVSPDYIAGSPAVERLVSLIDKGFITNATAHGYLTNMFGKAIGKVGWAEKFELGYGDVALIGGGLIEPSAVVAGSMGRLAGVWDDRAINTLADTDIVADETEFDEDSDTVMVTPVGKQKRTIGEALTWLDQ